MRFTELQRRFHKFNDDDAADVLGEECLVCDPRSGLSPQQLVENKFGTALRDQGRAEETTIIRMEDTTIIRRQETPVT